ncbi:hypothetical protein ILUMI_24643 [Ignelater luminosus]|uniref:Uncharacterized protein n=1 Tax=Ignelater luminosus TaxID=2038154 RepID=A0A8K0C5W6_IGNLU|nr:hypothetical protein ILUMI_24643 [Ignelater luminosus]
MRILDGYPYQNDNSTETAERERKRRKCPSVDVVFDGTMSARMAKERFLSIKLNKQRLITVLTERLLAQDFEVKQAVEDADSTITCNALSLDQKSGTGVIVLGKMWISSYF